VSRNLRPSGSTIRTVNLLIILVISSVRLSLLLLHSPLSISLHKHLYSSELLHPFFLSSYIVMHEEIFTDKYPLFINDIIELSLFLFNNVLLILLLIVIIIVLLIIKVLLWLLLLLFLHVIELIQYVLYLSLELFITLLHQIL